MTANRRVLRIGLYASLLLFSLPPLLLFVIGSPGSLSPDDAAASWDPAFEITGPAPALGLSQPLAQWTLLSASLFLGFAAAAWLVVRLLGRKAEANTSLAPKPRFVLLIVLGVSSLALYTVNFFLAFPLRRYYNVKQISVGLIADRDRIVVAGMALAIVALFLLFGLAYRLCRGHDSRRLWAVVLLGAFLLAGVNLLVAPITSIDLYDYIARGRIAGIHQGNPYTQVPNDYAWDPFMAYASWGHKTSAYGPLWETLSALLSRLAGNELWPNVLVYKGLALLCYMLSVGLIAAILRKRMPERALGGTLLFAWNPLILQEGLANGHNDLLMVVFFLAAFWVLNAVEVPLDLRLPSPGRAWRWIGAGAALLLLGASILVKFVPGLFLPFFFLYLFSGQKAGWQRIRAGLVSGSLLLLLLALLVVAHYLPFWEPRTEEATSFWESGLGETISRRVEMFRMSVPSVAKEALQQSIPEEQAQQRVLNVFLNLFGLSYLWLLLRTAWDLGWFCAPRWGERFGAQPGLKGALARLLGQARGAAGPPWEILLRACASAFLLYVLLVSFWFWPWYLIWPIALLALTDDQMTVLPLALAGAAGQLGHLAWNFVWYWWGISWNTLYEIDGMIVFATLVPALLVYLVKKLACDLRLARAAAKKHA